jgi:hypothetical protein
VSNNAFHTGNAPLAAEKTAAAPVMNLCLFDLREFEFDRRRATENGH